MKKIKIFKTLLIPAIGITAIGTIAAVSTSCSPVVIVTGVSLNKESLPLGIGKSDTLIATIYPENATDKSVTWSSSNPSVATVDNNGKVIAVGKGRAIITVKTNDGGFTDTCQVTVYQEIIHVIGVLLDKKSLQLEADKTKTLTATVFPENATDKLVTWSSSDSSVATVDNNGNVTAVGEGIAKITVKTNDGGYEDYCDVTVIQYGSHYVCVTANRGSTLELINAGENNPNLQYSTDCVNWATYSEPIHIIHDNSIYIKGDNPTGWSKSFTAYSTLSITGDVSISGSVMGLLDNGAVLGEEGDITVIPCDACFYRLFQNSIGITSVSEKFLPATTLADNCYSNMFHSCSSLTTAPELPAINLADYCYYEIFSGCTSLTTAPDLPATTLAEACYSGMFNDCSSLTTAPDLPATTLANNCYANMFHHCESLTTAPYLPAETLANGCYDNIFSNCTSLNSVKIAYTSNYDSGYFYNWVNGVADSGTFYYNGSQTAQDFQLPSGWTKSPF